MLARRRFLLQMAALALPISAPSVQAAHLRKNSSEQILLSASWDAAEGEVQGVFHAQTAQGAPAIALPGRGHGIVPLRHKQKGQALIVSRRLGSWLAKVDWRHGKLLQLIEAEFDRQFFGHAILTPDGQTLITTENHGETGQGILGVYSTQTLKRITELPSHGIGPHELIWLDQGKILAVAHGGILTLPETGRRKLNLDAMKPALTLLAWPSGAVLQQYQLPDPALSIRHLALAADGSLGAALQAEYREEDAHTDAPLLAVLREGQLTIAAQPAGLQSYAASIAAVGNTFLVSALKGNALARWRSDGTPLPSIAMPRPAGIASDGQQAWISSESGMLAHFDPHLATLTPLKLAVAPRWDNHLVLASH